MAGLWSVTRAGISQTARSAPRADSINIFSYVSTATARLGDDLACLSGVCSYVFTVLPIARGASIKNIFFNFAINGAEWMIVYWITYPPVKNVLYVWNRTTVVTSARFFPNVAISKTSTYIDKIDYLCYYLFMPAKKPLTLIEKHLTKEERESRLLRESALEPITQLSADVPFPLQGKSNKHAAQVWSRSIQLYSELKGKVATSLDQNLLIKYCKADQQFLELENLRSEKISQWEESKAKAKRVKLTSDEKQINAWAKMWRIVSDMEKIIIVLDARLDGKGKYLHSLEQSLYLTPRSRAGVAPVQKEKEKEDSVKVFD